ncbi:MAG: DNA-3-methyladenine glycosylase I [Bryobacteraceae bacterium]
MMDRIAQFKANPEFDKELMVRESRIPDFDLEDEKILGRMIALIGYSNNARADKITPLVVNGVFERAFQNYSIKHVAGSSPKHIIRDHWTELKAIRFKYKIESMIECAKVLASIQERYGSFMRYLREYGLPSRVESEVDIKVFWEAFNRIRAYLRQSGIPYFANFTSLCHLLLDQGFDCAKPDLAVMKTAVFLGIVPGPPKQKNNPEKLGNHPEASLRTTVETIQSYAVHRSTRAPVIDLYWLIRGGQTGVKTFMQAAYYA